MKNLWGKIIASAAFTLSLALSLTAMADMKGEAEDALLSKLREQIMSGSTASGLLFFSQSERQVAFRNINKLYPTRFIPKSSSPYPLEDKPRDFSGVSYEVEGKTYSLADFTAMTSHMGLIVVQGNDVLYEHYSGGNDRDTRWVSFSVTKSVTSMLIGAAIKDGYISSVDEPVAHYLPRLRGTPYEVATIKDVLNMSSGVAWNEDYADPDSDVAHAGGANGLPLVDYLSKLPREHEPGEVFNYNTGETNLVGEILRAAIGNNASTYLIKKIWHPFGMNSDANWLLGSPGGGETGGCCISATLRDYSRIGLFAMNNGKLRDGTEVLPANWMQDSTTPAKGSDYYAYLWWLMGDGSYSARGIFQQQIYIDPAKQLVIAAHSNAPTAVQSSYSEHLAAVLQALRAEVPAP